MGETNHLRLFTGKPTRRHAIVGGAMAFAGLAVRSACAQTNQAMHELPSTGADRLRTFLHQEVEFQASPRRIYEILLDSKLFSAFSGFPAEISPEAGGALSMFGGRIVGRNIELIPNKRIVQAWRSTAWDPGVYSIVRFELRAQLSNTRVVLDHTGFAEGEFGHLDPGWKLRYWDPLEKFLAAPSEH